MKRTHEEWLDLASVFRTAQPSSPQWFRLVDVAITYLVEDRIAETEDMPDE